jgi:nitrogen regulatory protein PII
MKAVFISYNQALSERITDILDINDIRGFTKWALTEGRGSVDGEPHYGSHAWPSMNASVLTIVDDEKVDVILNELRELDKETKMQGSRAFVWNVEQTS